MLDIHEVMNKVGSFQLLFKLNRNTKDINVKEHTKDSIIFDVIYFKMLSSIVEKINFFDCMCIYNKFCNF